MHATVSAKRAGLLVSNDELRDHIWSLLRPKHFLKWKERHIARFNYMAAPVAAPQQQHAEGAASSSDEADSSSSRGGVGAAAASGGPPKFELLPPRTYTACVQRLASGAWMVPCTDGTWLCVRPASGVAGGCEP